MTGADAIAILILLTIVIAIGVYLLHWLYRHSSKNQSFVRTGVGGERVVMGGGAFVLPIIHDVTVVNMNAVPIEIRRAGEHSLLTKNKMRIDVIAEFDVRVVPTEEGVSTAARSLGERTANPAALQEVIQGRFVDAMSAIAARHSMEAIHTNRLDYMKEVTGLVEETLTRHGLELENASLTSLNQSDITVFDPRNAFDAEGLTQLTEQVEAGRRRRNEIENETRVAIRVRDYEAEQRSLEIDRDLEYARLEQSRDIERQRSRQQAEIEEERASSDISIHTSKTRAEEEAERIRAKLSKRFMTDYDESGKIGRRYRRQDAIGTPLAVNLGVGFVPVRKPGKLPRETYTEDFALEYDATALSIHKDDIKTGQRVLIVDDLLATGGTIEATIKLVEKAGGNVVGVAFLIELAELKGRHKIGNYPIYSLLTY